MRVLIGLGIGASLAIMYALVVGRVPLMTNADDLQGRSTASTPSLEMQMKFDGTDGWVHVDVADCSTWKPSGSNEIVRVEAIGEGCIEKASSDATTILLAPLDEAAPFRLASDRSTKPWKSIAGYELRRLSSGPLMELSSVYIAAITCVERGRLAIVAGPDPEVVEGLVGAVTVS